MSPGPATSREPPGQKKTHSGSFLGAVVLFWFGPLNKTPGLATSRGASGAEKDTLGIVLSSTGFVCKLDNPQAHNPPKARFILLVEQRACAIVIHVVWDFKCI
jgi:hypothetical protein